MRDVTDSAQKETFDKIKETVLYLVHFLKNPLREITFIPDWSLRRVLFTQILLALTSGVLAGLIPPNVYRIAAGIFVAPVVSLVMALLMTLFLYYFFQILENRSVSIKKLLTLIVLANTPFFVFEVGSELLPPLTLVGFGMTAILMVVGLTENFQLDKKKALKVIGVILFVVFLIWIWNRIEIARLR